MSSWNDAPTTADYAYAAAGDANDRIKKAELRIEQMERRLQELEKISLPLLHSLKVLND